MRNAFANKLCELASQDERIWLLCGDLGFSVLEPFIEKFPDRFINVGVSEQNMVGVAAGLALEGKIVFTYSIVNFAVTRCLEQIRNDVCYHQLPVKIVGVGAGFGYGAQGYTHHGLEDIAFMRALPFMDVISPADAVEAEIATSLAAKSEGPTYLRLGKGKEPIIHKKLSLKDVKDGIIIKEGRDLAIISSGVVLPEVLKASELLEQKGIGSVVVSMPCLEPFNKELVLRFAKEIGKVVTVEEHGIGGLGSIVAEALASSPTEAKFLPLCVPRDREFEIGSQQFMRKSCGIDGEGIFRQVFSFMN